MARKDLIHLTYAVCFTFICLILHIWNDEFKKVHPSLREVIEIKHPKLLYLLKTALKEETGSRVQHPGTSVIKSFRSWPSKNQRTFGFQPDQSTYTGPDLGMKPVLDVHNVSDFFFRNNLFGNSPIEQFTVVILTYNRLSILTETLQRLKGVRFLNRVIVVNNNYKQALNISSLDIGVNIHVVTANKNSLNNRFLPFDEIETEAILSLDDDLVLGKEEIEFGFRVWREERDRIVGFPGRYHAWNDKSNSWKYMIRNSCQLSMVLTGAAFIHKNYTYKYHYLMPEKIRVKVDELLNCEDIAMNFLVAHLTKKPPLKIASRLNFIPNGRKSSNSSLSAKKSHFGERHYCLNFLANMYGYMPLLYTQYRADSILNSGKAQASEKCFASV